MRGGVWCPKSYTVSAHRHGQRRCFWWKINWISHTLSFGRRCQGHTQVRRPFLFAAGSHRHSVSLRTYVEVDVVPLIRVSLWFCSLLPSLYVIIIEIDVDLIGFHFRGIIHLIPFALYFSCGCDYPSSTLIFSNFCSGEPKNIFVGVEKGKRGIFFVLHCF